MSKISSYRLSLVAASGANFAIPAFTNKMSIFPSFCETSAYSLSIAARSATSARTARMSLPSERTASFRVPGSRPAMATRAPSSLNLLAVASPIPLLPPVTTATLPSSLFMIHSLWGFCRETHGRRECTSGAFPHLPYLDEHLNNRFHVFLSSVQVEHCYGRSVHSRLHCLRNWLI